jgi:hypothetical protein
MKLQPTNILSVFIDLIYKIPQAKAGGQVGVKNIQ